MNTFSRTKECTLSDLKLSQSHYHKDENKLTSSFAKTHDCGVSDHNIQ